MHDKPLPSRLEGLKDSPLGLIPEDWEVKALEECTQPDTVITYGIVQAGPHVENGVPYIRTGDMTGGELNLDSLQRTSEQIAASYQRSRVRTGEIVCAIRATVGQVLEVPQELDGANLTQGTARISPSKDINSHFLLWSLRSDSTIKQFKLAVKGTTFQEITLKDLRRIKLAIPFLQVEQQHIADILDRVHEAIQQTEELIAKLILMKSGLMHNLLTYGLDERGQLRDPSAHPEQFKDSLLGLIPREWKVGILLDYVSLPNGQLDPKQEPYRDWPLIGPDHIEPATGRLLALRSAAEQNAISGKYGFQPGDVLYGKINPYLRKAILADRSGLCSADIYPLRPGPTLVPRFLLALILGEHFSRFATAISMRSGIPKINREELGEFQAALPNFDEQVRISTALDAYDARIRAEEAYCDKLKHLKKGLMRDLLTGRVRAQAAEAAR